STSNSIRTGRRKALRSGHPVVRHGQDLGLSIEWDRLPGLPRLRLLGRRPLGAPSGDRVEAFLGSTVALRRIGLSGGSERRARTFGVPGAAVLGGPSRVFLRMRG